MLTYASVIVTFNRKKAIKNALLRQFEQTIKPQKIIVVDNDSNDGTYEYIKELIDKHKEIIKYIKLDQNYGGAGGFYYGMKEALKEKVDLIAISDDDASYDKNYFKKIIQSAEKNPQDMAFCGVMYNNKFLNPGTAKFLKNPKTLTFKPAEKKNYKNGDFYVDAWSFVGPVFRKKLIMEIGLPRKDYFIWYDDTEYSLRMHFKGYNYHVVANAKIYLFTEYSIRPPFWKEYYGFRNEINAIRSYSTGMYKMFYPYVMLIRKYGAIILKKIYVGRRKMAFKVFSKAFSDALKNNMGKTIDPQNSQFD